MALELSPLGVLAQKSLLVPIGIDKVLGFFVQAPNVANCQWCPAGGSLINTQKVIVYKETGP